MDAPTPDLDRLEEKLNRLKREYDLFLAGQRRGEPVAFREEVEREILILTKFPFRSTAAKFRMRNLAHRFRALETQIRLLLDQKRAKKREEEETVARDSAVRPSVVLDRAALDAPAAVSGHLHAIQRAMAEIAPDRPPPSLEALRKRLFDEARRILETPGIRGVRFLLVEDEKGPRIRGEVIREPGAG
ncbi:MAG: hypothetical protein HGA98_00480 [Deltaproteobacteria bacterium]|nr:hypothetical protein [Deltaproteobacteria bacterium]